MPNLACTCQANRGYTLFGIQIRGEGDTILTPLKQIVYENDFNKYMPKTEIRMAKLFGDAGIVGAALAAKK